MSIESLVHLRYGDGKGGSRNALTGVYRGKVEGRRGMELTVWGGIRTYARAHLTDAGVRSVVLADLNSSKPLSLHGCKDVKPELSN